MISRLSNEFESLKMDLTVATKKLESKSEAVKILWEMLEQCRMERDEFQRMAEQVMNRYQLLRKAVSHGVPMDNPTYANLSQLSSKQLFALLVESLEANSSLQKELCQCKQKLTDVYGDVEMLRKQLTSCSPHEKTIAKQTAGDKEKEEMVKHMELLTKQIAELERELSRCSDENRDLIWERDLYRDKCDRLSTELCCALDVDCKNAVDINAIISDKQALMHRLQTVEKEKLLAMSTLSKYQKMLDHKVKTSSSLSGSFDSQTPAQNLPDSTEHFK